jgi:hypothetical protein
MDAEDIMKDHWQREARKFCDLLKAASDQGLSLRPSRLYPEGRACSPGESFDLSDAHFKARDRELAVGLLDSLNRARSENPEIAAEFGTALTEAEKVWRGCIAG